MTKLINALIIFFSIILYSSAIYSSNDLISLFPLQNYNQNINDWISPSSSNYTKSLLTKIQQKQHADELFSHYFGNKSPWNEKYVNTLLTLAAPYDLLTNENRVVSSFNNQINPPNKIGYGVNFRPYSEQWLAHIVNNINLKQFSVLRYHSQNRAIALTNIQSRGLPTDEPFFFSYKIAGEGYPFDKLQTAVIWAGTPLYILATTRDHAWVKVFAPSFTGWVKSNQIARVSNTFVAQWSKTAKKNIAAITGTQISIIDRENKLFRFSGYIGMLFPAIKHPHNIEILIPVADINQQALIHHALLPLQNITLIPLLPTPQHFVAITQHLIGRPYGWGGMYFYSDCASELKNLYTVFGIWLPMHSSNQVDPDKVLGHLVDLSSSTPKERLSYLIEHGHPWMTLIYVGGHVIALLGSYPNPNDLSHQIVPLSYQNAWGLGVESGPSRRAVIGRSVLLPLLITFPEDSGLMPQIKKETFKLFYLDDLSKLPRANDDLTVLLNILSDKPIVTPNPSIQK